MFRVNSERSLSVSDDRVGKGILGKTTMMTSNTVIASSLYIRTTHKRNSAVKAQRNETSSVGLELHSGEAQDRAASCAT